MSRPVSRYPVLSLPTLSVSTFPFPSPTAQNENKTYINPDLQTPPIFPLLTNSCANTTPLEQREPPFLARLKAGISGQTPSRGSRATDPRQARPGRSRIDFADDDGPNGDGPVVVDERGVEVEGETPDLGEAVDREEGRSIEGKKAEAEGKGEVEVEEAG